MTEAGFEPAHPKITELESAALDHSAIQSSQITEEKNILFIKNKILKDFNLL